MSKNLQCLLLEDIKDLGRAGDIVTVSEGYARNMLFPEGKAVIADSKVRTRHAAQKLKEQREEVELNRVLQEKATVLDNSEITFIAKVKDGDQIYGSITKKQIVAKLNEEADLRVQEKSVSISAPLKKIGTYDMTVALSRDIECTMKVVVIADPTSINQKDEE